MVGRADGGQEARILTGMVYSRSMHSFSRATGVLAAAAALAVNVPALLAQGQVAYRVLSTSRTSTMQKELQQAAETGFILDGLTISETAFGGKELVCILRKEVTP